MYKLKIKISFLYCMLLLTVLFVISCTKTENNNQVVKDELKKAAEKINSSLEAYVPIIGSLAEYTETLYGRENRDKTLPKVDKNAYKLSKKGALYKPDFTSSAVFVSGFVPIDTKIKNIVYFTEPLETEFKLICDNNPNIVQVYYNDKYSYNRIYPGFDVLTQYAPKMDIPSFNFYFLADKKHNPSKKSVWINEPYVDPAGRGWMISLIKPVYYNKILEGVVGLDITINEIINTFIAKLPIDCMIISPTGMVVATSEDLSMLFSLPHLKNHKYIETVNSDTFLPKRYNLLKSKKKNIRNLAEKFLKDKKNKFKFTNYSKEFIIFKENISLLNWKIITVVEK